MRDPVPAPPRSLSPRAEGIDGYDGSHLTSLPRGAACSWSLSCCCSWPIALSSLDRRACQPGLTEWRSSSRGPFARGRLGASRSATTPRVVSFHGAWTAKASARRRSRPQSTGLEHRQRLAERRGPPLGSPTRAGAPVTGRPPAPTTTKTRDRRRGRSRRPSSNSQALLEVRQRTICDGRRGLSNQELATWDGTDWSAGLPSWANAPGGRKGSDLHRVLWLVRNNEP